MAVLGDTLNLCSQSQTTAVPGPKRMSRRPFEAQKTLSRGTTSMSQESLAKWLLIEWLLIVLG